VRCWEGGRWETYALCGQGPLGSDVGACDRGGVGDGVGVDGHDVWKVMVLAGRLSKVLYGRSGF